jgi:colanic acid biosynthesis protein WcaH
MTDEQFLQIVDVTPLVSIDLIIRNECGAMLLGKRRNRPALDCWFVPGGRIRKNERVAEARSRISKCELGVVVTEARLIGVFDHLYEDNFLGAVEVNTHYVVLCFAGQLPARASVTPDNQHSELRWWPVEELLANPAVHEYTKAYLR